MKSLLRSRLDKHFAAVSALVAAAAIGGAVRDASATIVYSGVVNIPTKDTTNGLYINIVTGQINEPGNGGGATVPGWDLNIYGGAPQIFYGFGGVVNWAFVGDEEGDLTQVDPGTIIDGSNAIQTGDAFTDGWPANAPGAIFGFQFQNENTGQINFGWGRYVAIPTDGTQGTLVEYAYDDSGAGIPAGATTSDPNAGACCKTDGTCATILAADCSAAGGTFSGPGTTCLAANCASRCCFIDGTCQLLTSSACTAAGGVATAGQSCASTCPIPGACCRNDGTCSLVTNLDACASLGGGYQGDGSTCATAGCGAFTVVNTVAGTFTDISGTGTPVTFETSPDDDTASITSTVTNALVTNPNLFVCTNGFISDSSDFDDFTNDVLPFSEPPMTFALFSNWDDLVVDAPGGVFTQSTVENGVNVFIVQWNQARSFAGGTGATRGTFEVKIFGPGGPALAQYIFNGDDSWDANGGSSTVGVQWDTNKSFQWGFDTAGSVPDNAVLSIVGAATGPTCYANCDSSTAVPFLNVADFTCFLQKFAAADAYANCDGSTQVPTLNVADFTCFLQKFAAGCSAP